MAVVTAPAIIMTLKWEAISLVVGLGPAEERMWCVKSVRVVVLRSSLASVCSVAYSACR